MTTANAAGASEAQEAAVEQAAVTPAAAAAPSLWSNRDYLGWWTGDSVSALGTSISNIAFPLLVLFSTGSVAKAGAIGAANQIGRLATTLPGGALADRISRRALLVLGPLVQSAALALVAVLAHRGHISIPQLAALACLSGLASGLAQGAYRPALRRIVPKEQLGAATGQSMGRDMAAELLGTPVGGVLFSAARWVPFLVDAVSFLFAALGAALIRRPLGPDRADGKRPASVFGDIAAGIRLVRGEPFLRFVVVWGSLLNVAAESFALLFIALIRYRGGGPSAVGVASAIALVGGIGGAVAAPALLGKVRARTLMYAAGWAFAVSLVLVAAVPRPWQIGAVILVAMFTMVPLNVVLDTYVVRLVPDAYSGRVSAVTRFGSQALSWTGPLAAGLLAALFGVPGGVLALLIAVVPLALALHVTKSLRILDSPVAQVRELTVDDADADAAAAAAAE
ncbi:MFS transporter [Actinocrinis puniceicyclus]|uniref:MFS transporter n=1 Tax=Actinocrinis puniceicyclus TaxID=977794 RepID=A0A8J7WPW8_9ACTN|nr:MFS transporter [Actinocrinis puniceicyclus]MBS2964182.1 MFS transporter [Actinocrinis puniceicyclus]